MGISFRIEKNEFPSIAQSLPGQAEWLVQEATFNILATSQDLVPVRDGFLKASGGADVQGDRGEIYYTMEYAPYVEFGTSRMRAQPYLTPAVEMERPRFELGMRRLFD